MRRDGMVNIGQLAKEQHKDNGVVRIGFGSYKGSVIAGKRWGATMQHMAVPASPKGTWEYALHNAGATNKILLSDNLASQPDLQQSIGHRAIGIVYNPEYEYGNYVPSLIPSRYEAFIYIDETTALHPLHIKPNGFEVPETYPWGE